MLRAHDYTSIGGRRGGDVSDTTRREFVFGLSVAVFTYAVRKRLTLSRGNPFRVGLVTSRTTAIATEITAGVNFGITEAGRVAQLVGGGLEVSTSSIAAGESLPSVLARMNVSALLVALSGEECAAAGEWADARDLLLFNLAATDDDLRGARCARSMFHVIASATMERRARVEAKKPDDAVVALWDSSLERYGAAQLNDRYRHATGQPMSSAAWTGWFAVKVIQETIERAQSTVPRALRDHLEKPATGFDGHKGELLTFRPADHQLRQPLYVSSAGDIVELPTDSALAEDAEEALDHLAGSAESSTCRWPTP
jgi:ABC-type branched-subunit amino acid transport system substrate-binding protein